MFSVRRNLFIYINNWNIVGSVGTCMSNYIAGDCPELPIVENGVWLSSNIGFGAVAYIECYYGFNLEGSIYMECFDDGIWLPSDTPACKSQ